MKCLKKLKKEFERKRLFRVLRNIEEEVPLICQEFGLDPEAAVNSLQFLVLDHFFKQRKRKQKNE